MVSKKALIGQLFRLVTGTVTVFLIRIHFKLITTDPEQDPAKCCRWSRSRSLLLVGENALLLITCKLLIFFEYRYRRCFCLSDLPSTVLLMIILRMTIRIYITKESTDSYGSWSETLYSGVVIGCFLTFFLSICFPSILSFLQAPPLVISRWTKSRWNTCVRPTGTRTKSSSSRLTSPQWECSGIYGQFYLQSLTCFTHFFGQS